MYNLNLSDGVIPTLDQKNSSQKKKINRFCLDPPNSAYPYLADLWETSGSKYSVVHPQHNKVVTVCQRWRMEL